MLVKSILVVNKPVGIWLQPLSFHNTVGRGHEEHCEQILVSWRGICNGTHYIHEV